MAEYEGHDGRAQSPPGKDSRTALSIENRGADRLDDFATRMGEAQGVADGQKTELLEKRDGLWSPGVAGVLWNQEMEEGAASPIAAKVGTPLRAVDVRS